MKVIRIVAMSVMVLITLFFITYSRIQAGFASELAEEAAEYAHKTKKYAEVAVQHTERALEAEAHAKSLAKRLEDCKNLEK